MDSLISHLLDAGRIEAGTPVGDARAVRGGRPGGCREEHVPERRWQAYRTDRSARGPSAGNGRPAAHRAGVEQPILQRRPARSGYLPDPGLRVADGIQVAISVRDEGRGWIPERLPYVFRKYGARGGGSRESGSGLGLAICKGVVEAHGGRIWANSAGTGQGTCITFTIPAAHDPDGASGSARRDSRAAGEVHEPTRNLVVDDDPETLRYV